MAIFIIFAFLNFRNKTDFGVEVEGNSICPIELEDKLFHHVNVYINKEALRLSDQIRLVIDYDGQLVLLITVAGSRDCSTSLTPISKIIPIAMRFTLCTLK